MVQPQIIYTGPIEHKMTVEDALIPFNVYECSNGSFVRLSDFLKIQEKCIESIQNCNVGYKESIEQLDSFTGDFNETVYDIRSGARRDLKEKERFIHILKIALLITSVVLVVLCVSLVVVLII